ncbi:MULTISPECIES: hypothetical protein [unclassified Phaeobacter]|uniref:hypothetical protein n=1 Tax=unclassified Phaeobacter TaxID=2621772 RepID=UPI003A8B9781
MTTSPRIPFNLSADPDKDPLRDKDNANPELKPKLSESKPRPNLAPGGSMGIRQGLPPREAGTPKKRFELGKGGELTREFKSIAPKGHDKDKGHDR